MAVKTEGLSAPKESEEIQDAGLEEGQEESNENESLAEVAEETEDKDSKPDSKEEEESEPLKSEDDPDEIDIDDIIAGDKKEDTERKPGYEKRIDKLTARLKSAEEKLSKYENKEAVDKGEYTEPQLRKALTKAINEGDATLIYDIMDYMSEQKANALRKEYQTEQKKVQEAQQQQRQEWGTIVQRYEDYSDTENEIYPGSSRDLNLKDQRSLLFQTATKLYMSDQEELFQRYHKPGGQELAVADALQMIIRKRGRNPKDKEKDLLKRKLAKEKRKKSLGSGSPGKEERAPAKPMTAQEKLRDYLEERKKMQKE